MTGDSVSMENIYGRVTAVEKEVDALAPIKKLLDGDTNHGSLPYRKMNSEVRRMIDLLDGNEERGVPSLRDQLKTNAVVLKGILTEMVTTNDTLADLCEKDIERDERRKLPSWWVVATTIPGLIVAVYAAVNLLGK